MALVPSPRAPARRKAAARSRPDDYPKGIVQLIYAILDERERTNNFLRSLVGLTIACCVVLYTAIAGMKGLHGLTPPVLIPGGVVGGGTLTYSIVRLVLRFRLRRQAASRADTPPIESSPDPNRTPAPQAGTPS
jgi:hypothetical protein